MIKLFTKKRKGFTLIELVVVIAILGILAALAIPRFSNARDNAAKSTVLADARSISSELEIVYAQEGAYPANGWTPSGQYSGTVAYSQTDSGTGYTVTYTAAGTTPWKITFTNNDSLDIASVTR